MRVLLLLRGSAGCGKSTYIEQHGLKPYTLSTDDIRLLCASPVLSVEGNTVISQENDNVVWGILMQVLETRMKNGEFTVIDATCSKTADINKYKSLAEAYKYRIYCIDMTQIPIEETKRRNSLRDPLKRVPEEVIEKMYSRFATQKVPSGIKVISPEELDTIWYRKFDLNKYKKIHVIGDIHGCYTALKEYLGEELKEDEAYIFLGDYLDRGIENAEVLKYLLSIYKLPNVTFLEGNHERHLRLWASGVPSKTREFDYHTKLQLDDSEIDKKDVREFCRRLCQCCYFTYAGKTFLVSHGGISNLPEELLFLPTSTLIKGVGNYKDSDAVDASFNTLTDADTYSIHGHRNVSKTAIQSTTTTYNLEGQVEFGGKLRAVEITADPFKIDTIEIKNTVFKIALEYEAKKIDAASQDLTVEQLLILMRASKNIEEKSFDNIHSFNFTREAFTKRFWDETVIKARGLFIDVDRNEVAARSYEKFFNINERPETKLDMLSHKFELPMDAFVKYNGYLGIISWDYKKKDFLVATKSSLEGEHAEWLRQNLTSVYPYETICKMGEYIKEHQVSFVFECCDVIHDRHIIEYDKTKLVLLDIIKNQINFERLPYEEMVKTALDIGLEYKELAATFYDWHSFFSWYNEITAEGYEYDGNPIEGFVISDANTFMVKIKTAYYHEWKKLRGVAQSVLRSGNYIYTGGLVIPEENLFFGWCKNQFGEMSKEERLELKQRYAGDICTLRNQFYADNAIFLAKDRT